MERQQIKLGTIFSTVLFLTNNCQPLWFHQYLIIVDMYWKKPHKVEYYYHTYFQFGCFRSWSTLCINVLRLRCQFHNGFDIDLLMQHCPEVISVHSFLRFRWQYKMIRISILMKGKDIRIHRSTRIQYGFYIHNFDYFVFSYCTWNISLSISSL